MALPVLACLFTGNIRAARQLILAQMLASSSSSGSTSHQSQSASEPLLIGLRNDHAWKVITKSLQNDRIESVAVLYGSSHIPDLTRRLTEMGFVPTRTKWRTAWSVSVPSFDDIGSDEHVDDDNNNNHSKNDNSSVMKPFVGLPSVALAVGLILLPLYFAIGGWDWITTLQQVARELEQTHVADAAVEVMLYLIRHALTYLGLAKFVVEWDSSSSGSFFEQE